MKDSITKSLERFGINLNSLFHNDPSLKEKLNKSGESFFRVLVHAISNAQFIQFKDDLTSGNFESVYSSEVFDTICQLCKEDNIVLLNKDTRVLRARIVKEIDDIYHTRNGIHFEDDVLRGYNWINSKEPAIGIASEGRANYKYSSYFYCAEDGPTAASEIKPNIGDYVSLASFYIKRDLRLIKLEEKDLDKVVGISEIHKHYIAQHFSAPVNDSQNYYLTQFISDELRKYGVDGICYKSHFTEKNNYVIFNCSMDSIEFSNSKIIKLHSHQLNFIDYSSKLILKAKGSPCPSEEEIEREKQYLIDMIEGYKEESIITICSEQSGQEN